jgi:hypothetical protein
MRNPDFIPRPDADFDIWQGQFMTGLTPARITAWKITPADQAALVVLQTAWANAWTVAKDKGSHTSAQTVAKDEARTAYEQALRIFVSQWLRSNTLVTDDQRRDLGITVRDSERTPIGIKTNAPLITFDPAVHTVQTVRFGNPDDPHTQAMPAGQKVFLERFVGDKGLDPAVISFGNAQVVTRFLHTIQYTEADVGKTVYLRACYVNTKGEKGPFSPVLSAVIM